MVLSVVVSSVIIGVLLATALLLVTRHGSASDAAPEAVELSLPSSAVHAEMELLVSLVADRGYSTTVICDHDKGDFVYVLGLCRGDYPVHGVLDNALCFGGASENHCAAPSFTGGLTYDLRCKCLCRRTVD